LIKYPLQLRDSYTYLEIINAWEKNGRIIDAINFFPLSLWILKKPYELFNCDIIKGGLVINCAAGIAIVCLAIQIAHKLFGNWMIDLFVGLTAATHPFLIETSCYFLRENLFILFSVIAFYFFVDYYKNYRILSLLLISVFSCLGFLSRTEGFELIAVYIMSEGFCAFKKKRPVSQSLMRMGLFMLAFFITAICIICLMDLDFMQVLSIVDVSRRIK
jgi:hypothetical protein